MEHRYYKRIIFFLLIICVIPIILLGGSVGNLVSRQREKLYQAQQANVVNQQSQLDTIFGFIEVSTIRMALKSDTIQAIKLEREASNFLEFNSMKSNLQMIQSSDLHVDDIFLISNEKNWIMGVSDFTSIEESTQRELIEQISQVKKTSFWHSDDKYLYLVKRLPVNTYADTGMLMVRFEKRKIEDEIFKANGSLCTLVFNEEGQAILGAANYKPIIDYVQADVQSNALLEQGEVIKVMYHASRYALMSAKSEYNRWIYTMVVPEEILNQDLAQVFVMLLLVFLCLIIIEPTVIYACAKRLYRPICEIHSVVETGIKDETELDQTLGGEVDLTKKLQYIIHKNVEMKKELTNHTLNQHQLFLRKVYQDELDNLTASDFIKHGITEVDLSGYIFHVIAIKYHNAFETADERKLYMFALENVLNELLDKKESFPLVAIGKIAYFTYYIETDNEECVDVKLQGLVSTIISAVEKYIHLPINVGVSRSFERVEGIVNAVEECKKALQNMIVTNKKCNFYNQPRLSNAISSDNKIRQSRMKVIQMISAGDKERCQYELGEYFDDLQDMNYYLFKLEISKMVSQILDYYAEYIITPDYEKVGDIIEFDITKEVNSIENLKSNLWDYLIEPLFKRISEPAENIAVISKIIEYLNDNIEEDINLEECARHFNYNANYLSRMFKKHFGKNYTDYVIEKKMERCKELLKTTDITVNELTERFGYSCPQNFIRVFKKYTLVTPGQYRKQMMQKKENE